MYIFVHLSLKDDASLKCWYKMKEWKKEIIFLTYVHAKKTCISSLSLSVLQKKIRKKQNSRKKQQRKERRKPFASFPFLPSFR